MSVTDGVARATRALTTLRQREGTPGQRTGPGRAGWWASVATTCFLAMLVFAGLRLVAIEAWLHHPYDFLGYWAPVTAVALLATWHLATAGMVPLWLFAAYEAAYALHESVVQGHDASNRLVTAALVLAWVAMLARRPGLRPVRSPARSTLAMLGLAMTAGVTCYGACQFGPGVFDPRTTYPAWAEEPDAREGLGEVTIKMVKSATAMGNSQFTLTYALMSWDAARRLTHGQADYLAHEVFCHDMAGASKDGNSTFDFEFVDYGMAPLGTATMTAAACHR